MIYLDNASTTMISPEVLQEMLPYMQGDYGNAGTLHQLGRRAAKAVEKAREQVAGLFGCQPENIVFTSGGSESNNLAIKGLKFFMENSNRRHIITSAMEHDSVLKAVVSLEEDDFEVTYLQPSADGLISARSVKNAMRDDTGLVALMYVNNEIGTVNDIVGIGKVCDRKQVIFHTDCVQAVGCHEMNTVFVTGSISSHKLHGPKGVGALYAKNPRAITPLISGGGTQEFGVRGGTENVAGIVGFGKACEIALSNMEQDSVHILSLKRKFFDILNDVSGIHINGNAATEPGKVLNLRIDGVSSETLMLMLDAEGVCVSASSACRAHESEPSHVLIALGLTPDEARSSVRFSFSKYNTQDEVTEVAKILASCISTLRQYGEVNQYG
jgi:cysteine desulfurase